MLPGSDVFMYGRPMHCRRNARNAPSQKSGVPSGGERRQKPRGQWQSRKPPEREEVGEEKRRSGEQVEDCAPTGACPTMCPARELRERESQLRLHRFEVLPGTEAERRPRGDPARAVKEYSRPAAGKDATDPSELRPPAVLLRTVRYLISDITASPSLQPWTEVYGFVFDRLRSVKQDMIIQRLSGPDCTAILEPTVRFLIYASYRLCGEPLRLYDPCINDTHLQEHLSWLLACYAEGPGPYPNQDEFQALGLLYNLGSSRAAQHVLELPERVRRAPPVELALALRRALAERNPVRLLRLAQRLDFLQACALHRHLPACRRDLLLLYSHGFSSRGCRFPLERLARLLWVEVALAAELCRAHGVELAQRQHVLFSKNTFTEAEALNCKPYHSVVSDKQKDWTLKSIIDM